MARKQVVKQHVKSNLEAQLMKRSSLVDLVDKDIIPLDAALVSPSLAAPASSLAAFLERRPTAEEVKEKGILKEGGVVASSRQIGSYHPLVARAAWRPASGVARPRGSLLVLGYTSHVLCDGVRRCGRLLTWPTSSSWLHERLVFRSEP